VKLYGLNKQDAPIRSSFGLRSFWSGFKASRTGKASISTILTHGPNAMRTNDAVEEALKILAAHGCTVEVSAHPRIIKTVDEVSR
jgi:hypothetical protein